VDIIRSAETKSILLVKYTKNWKESRYLINLVKYKVIILVKKKEENGVYSYRRRLVIKVKEAT